MLGAASALEDVRRCLIACSERAKGPRFINVQENAKLFCELFSSLLTVLRFGLRHGESFLRFLQAAAKEIPPTPEIHDVLAKVFASTDATIAAMPIVEREKVYLLFSLQAPGSLMRTVQRCFRVTSVMHEYYDPDVPFFSESFLTQELQPTLMKLARLKLKAPSVEDGLRALHLDALAPSADATERLMDPPQITQPDSAAASVVASHAQSPASDATVASFEQPAGDRGSSSALSNGPFERVVVSKPLSVASVPVVVKKKKRSKLSAESSTQTMEDDMLHRTRQRSVAIAAQPSMREIAVQSTIVGSGVAAAAVGASLGSERSALEAWEAALAARERSLTARAFELQDRERTLFEREQLLFGVEASMSPPRSSRTFSLQHVSPAGRSGRCLSNAIRAAVQDADHPRHETMATPPATRSPLVDHNNARQPSVSEGVPRGTSPSPKARAPPLAINRATPTSSPNSKGHMHSVSSPTLAATSPQATRVSNAGIKPSPSHKPQALLASSLEWVDVVGAFASVLAVDAVAEQQGYCCAACSIPVQKEEVDASSSCCLSSSTPTPQESARATPRIVSKVIASAAELKQQLENRLARASSQRSSQSAARGEETPPSASSSADATAPHPGMSAVHASGYRYCYYTGSVFCKACLPDDARFPIPAKIVVSWDFGHYPVNLEALGQLQKYLTAPTILGAALDPLLDAEGASIPKLKAARGLRRQLRILHTIVGSCPDASHSPEISRIIASRYVALDEPYSIRDLIELEGAVLPTLQSSSGSPLVSDVGLLDKLKKMRDTLVIHCVKQCEGCKRQSAKPCGLCSDRKPLFLFDTQNTVVCGACSGAFHNECWRMAESQCPRCGR